MTICSKTLLCIVYRQTTFGCQTIFIIMSLLLRFLPHLVLSRGGSVGVYYGNHLYPGDRGGLSSGCSRLALVWAVSQRGRLSSLGYCAPRFRREPTDTWPCSFHIQRGYINLPSSYSRQSVQARLTPRITLPQSLDWTRTASSYPSG